MSPLPSMDTIYFLPLDVPPLANKNALISRFAESPHESYVWWNMEVILGERKFQKPLGSYTGQWTDSAKNKYPDLIAHISQYLPFSQLCYVHLSRAVKSVPPHVDENYVEKPFEHHMNITPSFKEHLSQNEPVGYRFILAGQRDSLYLCTQFDPQYQRHIAQKKLFCKIPEDTDFFLIRNSTIPHGVENTPQDSERLIGFVLGFLDVAKHKDLVKKSYFRFSENIILKHHLENLKHEDVS